MSAQYDLYETPSPKGKETRNHRTPAFILKMWLKPKKRNIL